MELVESIEIAVRCETCGDAYGVPPAALGAPVDPEVLEELRRAWAHLAESAARHGALGPVLQPLRAPPSEAERRERRLERLALARWQDDGGR